jgi:MoxR-like ATPase
MRVALREFLAANPAGMSDADAVRQELNGRLINNLTKPDLRGLLRIAGIDPMLLHPAHTPGNQPMVDTDQDDTDQDEARDLMTPPDTTWVTPDGRTVDLSPNIKGSVAPVPTDDDAIAAEVNKIRSDIMGGGFAALDQRLRDLVIASRKPAEVVTVTKTVTVEVPVERDGDTVTPRAAPTDQTVTWRKAFGVRGALGSETATVWDGAHPDTPCVNDRYVWPAETSVALTEMRRGNNVMLFGPKGTGKTEFAQQIAARLRRPFVLISCDASTDAATLVGMTVPARDGKGVSFQPGQLTRAIQTPGAVICIDEPSIARPGALFALQNVLTANRSLYIQETGQKVRVAPGVIFMATDNTSGMGGGSRTGYHGTQALNAATLDRFGVRIKLGWHAPDVEAGILMSHVPGCTRELADLLVQAATTTRAAADQQVLTEGLGLRRLFAWAGLLADGHDPDLAFRCAVQNCVPDGEQEALRQQCLLAVDKNTVRAALNPGAPAPSSSPAADDFDVVSPDDVTGEGN